MSCSHISRYMLYFDNIKNPVYLSICEGGDDAEGRKGELTPSVNQVLALSFLSKSAIGILSIFLVLFPSHGEL